MNEPAERRLKRAAAYLGMLFPHLAGAVAAMDLRVSAEVPTASVFPSGRVLFSPAFLSSLSDQQVAFVIAHELYHVRYGVFDRFEKSQSPVERRLQNIAHDFVVNDLLFRQFAEVLHDDDPDDGGRYLPEGGLYTWRYEADYRELTGGLSLPSGDDLLLENLYQRFVDLRQKLLSEAASGPDAAPSPFDVLEKLKTPEERAQGGDAAARAERAVQDAVRAARGGGRASLRTLLLDDGEENLDLRSRQAERRMFPDEPEVARRARAGRFRNAVEKISVAQEVLAKGMSGTGRGFAPGDGVETVQALAGRFETPWEAALQRSVEDFAWSERTWARASRRGADRVDVVLPGRRHVGFSLNLVVDVSGSMGDLLPLVFGLIQSFARSAGLVTVRLLTCDTQVTCDEVFDIEALSSFQVRGYGGSDMSPAMLRLAEDPAVERVLVLTDGYISTPPAGQIPYDVTWVLPAETIRHGNFQPGYGRQIAIPEVR